jgi:WD40 repeat protein
MKRVHTFGSHKKSIEQIDVRPSDTTVVSLSSDGSMKIWDAATKLVTKSIGRQKRFAISPDGRHILSLADDNRLLIWDFKGEFVQELTRVEGDIESISYIRNGAKIVVTTDSDSKVLAAESGKLITVLKDVREGPSATAISPNGQLIAFALRETDDISIWNSETGELVKKFGIGSMPLYAVGFSKDGRAVAFGRTPEWNDLNDRGPLESVFRFAEGDAYQVSFENRINTESEFVRARDVAGDVAIRPKESASSNVFEIQKSGRVSGEVKTENFSCYTLTPDGRHIIVGTFYGDIEVYKTDSPPLAFLFGRKGPDLVGHQGAVWALAASPDNRTVVSASADHTLRVWDIESGTNILTMFVGPDNEWVAWTPEGYYTSSLNGDKYLGWHASRGNSKNADYFLAAQFQKQYYRPGVVAQYLKSRDMKLALQQENVSAGNPPATREPEIASGPAIDVTTIAPPVVVFTSPEDANIVVDEEFFTVKAVAVAAQNTPPVSEIKVFLNGTEVASRKDSKQEMSIEKRLQLQPGENEVSVVALNEKATSQRVIRKINFRGTNKTNTRPNLRILAIGISNYRHPAFTLKFADKDALDIEAIFKAQENVNLLFNKVYSKTILNEQATREAIIEGLNWLTNPQDVRQGDFILLFLSGHGGLHRDNYYFYTYNHDPQFNPEEDDIKWNILLDRLTRVSGTKPILFVDTCRAGAAAGDSRSKGDQDLTQAIKDLRYNYEGVVFFASSSSDERSLEMESLQQGTFTHVLLEGLKGKADQPPGDRMIEVDELGGWIRRQVKKVSNNHQTGIYEEPLGFKPFPLFALPKP